MNETHKTIIERTTMTSGTDFSLSFPVQHYQDRYASRHRPLRDVIVHGFESLLHRKNVNSIIGTEIGIEPAGHQAAATDGRRAGYVVWAQRNRVQQLQENHDSVWSVASEDSEEATPLVVYGGGRDGLFTVRLRARLTLIIPLK